MLGLLKKHRQRIVVDLALTAVTDLLIYVLGVAVGLTIHPWMYVAGIAPLTLICIFVLRTVFPTAPQLSLSISEWRRTVQGTKIFAVVIVSNTGTPTALRGWNVAIESGGHTYPLTIDDYEQPYTLPLRSGNALVYHPAEHLTVRTMSPITRGDIVEGWMVVDASGVGDGPLNDPTYKLIFTAIDAAEKRHVFMPARGRHIVSLGHHPGLNRLRGRWEVTAAKQGGGDDELEETAGESGGSKEKAP